MKRTSADEVIIHALWPGPDDTRAFGVPFETYASRSATRVARSTVPEAGVLSGCAHAAAARPTVVATPATSRFRILAPGAFWRSPCRVMNGIRVLRARIPIRRAGRVHGFRRGAR